MQTHTDPVPTISPVAAELAACLRALLALATDDVNRYHPVVVEARRVLAMVRT